MEAQKYRDENGKLILKRVVNRSPMNQNKEVRGDKRYYFQASLDYNRLFAHAHRVGVFGMDTKRKRRMLISTPVI